MQSFWALEELQHDISKKDLIKAELVLDEFGTLSLEEQQALLEEIEMAPTDFALPLLIYLQRHQPDACEQLTGFKKIYETVGHRSPTVIVEHLKQFSANTVYYLQLASQLGIKDAATPVLHLLENVDETAFQIAALNCLERLSVTETLDGISEFFYVDDFNVAAAAVMAAGRIQSPLVSHYLKKAMGRQEKLDSLIVDILAEIQDDSALNLLSQKLADRSALVRNHARGWLVAIGEPALPYVLPNLKQNDRDLKILSLNVLQEIGSDKALQDVRLLVQTRPADPNIRFAAYEALADISNLKGDYTLAGGLEDPDSNVRVAAARAIDRNLDLKLVSGIKNMITIGGQEAEIIVQAIIDSMSGELFRSLLDCEMFTDLAREYLGIKASEDAQNYFMGILAEEEVTTLVHSIQSLMGLQAKVKKGTVWAVDDSKMVLNLYRSFLIQLGYTVELFDNGMSVLERLKKEKPDIICSDLNMPGMTGIELIQGIRKYYTMEQLPVFLVTTQSDVQNDRSYRTVDINAVLLKPFDKEQLERLFASLNKRG